MRLLKLILPALLALIAGACSHVRPVLTDADALMEADADSALTLLCAIDTASLTPTERPLYALLLTQAQIKTNATVTSDSLIAQAYSAYRFSSNPSLRLRAHFYAAQVAYYAKTLKDAMQYGIEAYEIAKEQNDPYWRAKTAELISDIQASAYCYTEAEDKELEAIEFYLKAGKITNHRYALCDLAIIKINQNQSADAISILDSLRDVIAQEQVYDAYLDNYAIRATMLAYYNEDRFDKVDEFLRLYQQYDPAEEELSMSIIQGGIAATNNEVDKMTALMSNAYGLSQSEQEYIKYKYAEYRNAIILEDYRTAALMADTLMLMQSDIAANVLNESVTSAQRDFYSRQTLVHKNIAHRRAYVIALITIIASLIFIFGIIIYRQKIKAQHAKLESNINAMLRLAEQSSANRMLLEQLFKERWKPLNSICVEYAELGDSDNMRERLFKKIQKELLNLRKPQNLKDFTDTTDKYNGEILTKIRRECPFISEDEIIFLAFVLANFSAKTISFLIGITPDSVYQKKDRLIKRIAKSDAPNKQEFINQLRRKTQNSANS